MEKYNRQILLEEIGKEGQKKLEESKVAIVGMGALGTIAAELLTRAGIGKILLIDRDIIEESNLQRQFLFEETDLGKSKAKAAQKKLKEINSLVEIKVEIINLNYKNINLLKKYDLILDCTDNLETRFLLNDFSKKEKIPLIYAAAIKTSGYVFPVLQNEACLNCFLQEASLDTCDNVGVLNTITASIAALEANLALKILLGKKIEPLLFYYNIWDETFRRIKIKKNPKCRTCQSHYDYLQGKENTKIIRFCSLGKFQILGKQKNLKLLGEKWEKVDKVIKDKDFLQFKNILLFKDGRALIKANSEREALAVYSKWIGN